MSRVEQKIDIQAPIESCYKALLHFERYPEFIPDVQSIRQKGSPDVWRWQVNASGGSTLEWDIEVQGGKHQHHAISWRTIRDADVAHSGAVTLQALDEKQTRLRLVVEYKTYAAHSDEAQVGQCLERALRALKTEIEQGAHLVRTGSYGDLAE